MASIALYSDSAKLAETGKKVLSHISSLVSVITPKIKDAGVAVVAAIGSIDVDLLKESLGIFHDWFSWLLPSVFALRFTDTGEAFFSANNSVLKAMFLLRFISFLTTLVATLFQMHKRNIAPLLLMVGFEGGASILAASMFSLPALWISVTLWLCIFMLLGYYCYSELKEMVENQNQEGSITVAATTE